MKRFQQVLRVVLILLILCTPALAEKLAVIVVDVQGDFTKWKKGSLAVDGTDEAYVKKVEAAVRELKKKGIDIYATQDWHPEKHKSFFTNHNGKKAFEVIKLNGQDQVLWPPHCVQGTENAKILIDNSLFKAIVKKGTMDGWDSYSGFYVGSDKKTGLEAALKKDGAEKLIVFGIATDYCVRATAIDGSKLGFDVIMVNDLSRGVNPKTIEKAKKDMAAAGVKIVDKLDEVKVQ